MNKGEIKIFQSREGKSEIQVQLKNETVWLSQKQISQIFGVDRTVITKHLNNILKSGELEENSVCAFFAHTAEDGKTYETKFYNLDMIISVGYRVNSKEATQFRIWATSILKEYLIKGYSLNQKRLQEKGYNDLEGAINLVKKAIGNGDISHDEALGLLDIITGYTKTWLLLQKYDENQLPEIRENQTLHYKLDAQEATESLQSLKTNLIEKAEASSLFAQERQEKVLEGIFGNIYQTYAGIELYPSIESKAAHLLYFIVKDHPFSDGNKRSGAFLFILFLAKNKIFFDEQGQKKINERALVAITLLIAESNPKDKEIMTHLVMHLISG